MIILFISLQKKDMMDTVKNRRTIRKYQQKDITPDLSDRIRNELPKYREINEFVKTIKNPSLTTGRIKRSFFQCLFDIEKEEPVMPYLRVLGMKKEASSLLSKMDDTAKKLFAKDLLASDLYRQVFCHKYNQTLPNEYQHSPIVL